MDNETRALGSVIAAPAGIAGKAMMRLASKLDKEHFTKPENKVLFTILDNYFMMTGGIVKREVVSDLLVRKGWEESAVLPIEAAYDAAANSTVSDDLALYAIQALREGREHDLTGHAITTAYGILDTGEEVDGEVLKGGRDARRFLIGQIADIESAESDAAPEGDVGSETESLLARYAEAKAGVKQGVRTGFPTVDRVTAGLSPGEIMLVAAYTSQGKSQYCVQQAWRAAVEEGKNVYYATTETLRSTIVNRLVARHSTLEKFGIPEGLDSKRIEEGSLSEDEEAVLYEVMKDLKDGTGKDYGKLHVVQVPQNGTLSTVSAHMTRTTQLWPVEYSVIDSINLLLPDRPRQKQQEELVDGLKAAKRLATTFDGGRGVQVVSPWQMSVNAFETALDKGAYSLHKSMSDTSEAQKTPDLIVSLLKPPDSARKATLQILKARNAAIPPPIELSVDYRTSTLEEVTDMEEEEGSMFDV